MELGIEAVEPPWPGIDRSMMRKSSGALGEAFPTLCPGIFLISSAGGSVDHCIPIWYWMHWNKRLAEADMDASVGSVGDSCDNALAETINGLYTTEVIRRRGPWRNMEEVEYATLEWVDWFNKRRLLEPIGDVPPAEFEMMYYRQLEESAMVA